jgi:hypothetical protein
LFCYYNDGGSKFLGLFGKKPGRFGKKVYLEMASLISEL